MSEDEDRLARLQRFVGGTPRRERIGRYRLLEMLGEGGAGIVFRARDEELGRDVALKMLKTAQSFSDTQVERFLREARHAARLRHPGIATVYETGRDEDVLYTTMELVSGRPFDPAHGTIEERVRILARAARAVHYAHEQGILHRDLKPGNILVDSHAMPRVLDFGLSRDVADPEGLTQTGAIFGTPGYMAPEQAQGRGHLGSATADVYSLGTLLYEVLAGRLPFEGESMPLVLHRVLTEEPERPAGPQDLVTIALKALEKDPARRYPSAAAFADDLERFLAGEPTLARPPSLGSKIRRHVVRRWRAWVGLGLLFTIAALLISRTSGGDDGEVVDGLLRGVEGEVFIVAAGTRTPARIGQRLTTGQGLLTSGPRASATVSYADGTRLDLGRDSSIRQGRGYLGTPYSRVANHVTLLAGKLTARVPTPSGKEPFYVSTPHAASYLGEGEYVLEAAPAWTRLEAWKGAARLVALRGGPVASLAAGQYGVLESGMDVVVRRMNADGIRQDDLVCWLKDPPADVHELPPAFDHLNRGWSAFLVLRPKEATSGKFLQLGKDSEEDAITLERVGDGSTLRYGVREGNSPARQIDLPGIVIPGEAQRITLIHAPTGGVAVSRNGLLLGSGFSPLAARPSPRTRNSLRSAHPGEIREVLIYERALSETEQARVDEYLALRHGTSISAETGWKGEYFADAELKRPRLTRRDAFINFDWGPESPDLSIPSDRFSARWTGRLQPLHSEPTTFHVIADDGVRLWVDGRLLVDSWIDQVPTEFMATVSLVAGRPCDIRMEFYEQASSAQAKLFWSSPSMPKSCVPSPR